MKSPIIRLTVAAAVVVLIFGGAWYSSHKGGVFREIHLPEQSISTIPMKIGNWQGEDIPVDERLFGKIAAHEVISRRYANPDTEEGITLHGAVFNTFWRDVPHSPKICYPNSGWTTIKEEDFELDDPEGLPATAHLVTFEKDGKSVYVLYWFQFGEYVVYDSWQMMKARWNYRDLETWPPSVKMMIQISADRPERAKKLLKEYADALHKITRTFQ